MKVFVVPDIHFPYHSKNALNKILKLIKQHKPTHVVQLGDLLDQYCFSKFSRSHNITTPEKEISKGIKLAIQFWKDVHKASPRAKCYQLLGNHDVRIKKRIADRLPELESLFDIGRLYQFKGVKVLKSDRDCLKLQGVVYIHGHYSKSIDHAKHYMKNVVHGHLHRPGITTFGSVWSMDCGHVADENSLPLSYNASKVTRWRLACGLVEDGKPMLVLL